MRSDGRGEYVAGKEKKRITNRERIQAHYISLVFRTYFAATYIANHAASIPREVRNGRCAKLARVRGTTQRTSHSALLFSSRLDSSIIYHLSQMMDNNVHGLYEQQNEQWKR